jgi:hypothetical protein
MGAVIRAERGVRLNAPLAGRVSAVLLAEPALPPAVVSPTARRGGVRWWQPLAGAAVAAGVATVSVLWLRAQAPVGPLTAAHVTAPPAAAAALPVTVTTAARGDSYVVPRAPQSPPALVPTTELANYVVAHSMFSSPVARRNLLSAFMTSEPAAAGAEGPPDNAKTPAQ